MKTEPDNPIPCDAPLFPGGGQHRAILAGIQAVRPRCAAGAPPGPRLRVTHAHTRPGTTENGHKRLSAGLTGPALSRDDIHRGIKHKCHGLNVQVLADPAGRLPAQATTLVKACQTLILAS